MKNGKKPVTERVEISPHIVADPEVCHGKPTFKGTRIMVWQVLDDVADGRSWEFICNVRWGGRIPLTAIGEAVELAQAALLSGSKRQSFDIPTGKTPKKTRGWTDNDILAQLKRSARRSARKGHELAVA